MIPNPTFGERGQVLLALGVIRESLGVQDFACPPPYSVYPTGQMKQPFFLGDADSEMVNTD